MPSVMRLVWPFIFRVATKSPKIYAYKPSGEGTFGC